VGIVEELVEIWLNEVCDRSIEVEQDHMVMFGGIEDREVMAVMAA